MTGKATPATTQLERLGVTFTIHAYVHEPKQASYAAEAAEKLGIDSARVHKTLVADIDGSLWVAIVPADAMLDLKALAAAAAGKRATMADPIKVERSTGYVLGGVSPFGQRKVLRTVLDAAALRWATIMVSAGRRGLEIEIDPKSLVDVLQALIAPISRREPSG